MSSSRLRGRELVDGKGPALSDDTVMFLVRDSVMRRRSLIHGRLTNEYGAHCAMGCFWEDNPGAIVNTWLIDEVAAVNDSLGPKASAKERWKKVNSWLRFKLRLSK